MTAVGMRLRSARQRAKGKGIVDEVFADKRWTRLLLIAGDDADDWTVVPVQMAMRDLARALMIAAVAVERMAEHEKRIAGFGEPVRIEVRERGDGPVEGRAGPPRKPECRIAEDGSLRPPAGEEFVLCGECVASRWYATSAAATPEGPIERLVCAGCGNEVRMVAVMHAPGTA